MRHPTDGTLRRLLDEPAGVADADREHVAGCPECLSGLAAAREDAAMVGAALHVEVTADVENGWRRQSQTLAKDRETGAREKAARENGAREKAARRRATALRTPVIAGVIAAALLAGATAAAAGNWLPIFRTERVAPVVVTQADLLRLPDLSAYGDVTVTQRPNVRKVADAAAAQKTAGLAVPRVGKLPRGVTGEPAYQVGDRLSATFTFSVKKAAQTAAAAGQTLPTPPAGLDGSQFRFTAGPGLAVVWSRQEGVPSMIVARAVAPAAYSSGIPFQTARAYVLSLPGLPADVAAQLRTFTGDGKTLPLVVNAGEETTSTADVGGVPATVLATRDGTMAGVVWVQNGVVTAVAGSLSVDEVLSVARGLR